jgi:enoyl-[acyl-carrier-protein] reductase (NADH)
MNPSVQEKNMGFLAGKRLLITGVLNNRSIAYGIAKACHREGAELAFSYQGERFKDRITEYAAEFGSKLVFECDVGSDEQIERLFADLGAAWEKPSPAIFSTASPAKTTTSRTTSRPTASAPWPRPQHPGCAAVAVCSP